MAKDQIAAPRHDEDLKQKPGIDQSKDAYATATAGRG